MPDQPTMFEIRTDDLVLDEENPRFFHLVHRDGKQLTQDAIEKEIVDNDDDITLLTKSIQKSGVKDPIWAVPRDDGRYLVLEGNRRTVVLRRLLKAACSPRPVCDMTGYRPT